MPFHPDALPRLKNVQLEMAIQHQERLALTGEIWTEVRKFLAAAPEICYRTRPAAYPVAYWIWQLYKKKAMLEEYGVIYSTPGFHHLPMAFLLLGFLGGIPCYCDYCRSRNFEDPDGRL